MSALSSSLPSPRLDYPESDGQPMADNTKQFEWIVILKGGLDAVFRDDPNVFIAGDLLWYPVEGHPEIRQAPDVLAALGRPKGHRRSYLQWEEGNVAPQVVFEVLSPGNRPGEMVRKFKFYDRYRVEEYYVYDPDTEVLDGWLRQGHELQDIAEMNGWVSPRLGIRFDLSTQKLQVFGPDGRRFASFVEVAAQRDQEEKARIEAQRQAAEAQRQAAEALAKAERLAAQLKALGIEPQRD
jgi:Uma2 family endonuclease